MININDQGQNNYIEIDQGYEMGSFNLFIEGNNNRIIFRKPLDISPATRVDIWVSGDKNKISVNSIFANQLTIHCVDGLRCAIAKRTSINGAYIASNEPSSVHIGRDCLFATEVKIYPTDFHKIFSNGQRINPPEPIVIGDRVWLCERAMVLSGAVIGNGCVIGAAAVVTGQIPRRSVAVGNPAYVVRSDIEWGP
ncbi:acyltransferase [Methylomagnum sp.]